METSDFFEAKCRGFALKVRMFASKKSDVFRRKQGVKTVLFPRFGAFSRHFPSEVRSSYPKTTEGRVREWAEMAAKTPKSTLERSPDLVKIILYIYIFLTLQRQLFLPCKRGVCNRSGTWCSAHPACIRHCMSAPSTPHCTHLPSKPRKRKPGFHREGRFHGETPT